VFAAVLIVLLLVVFCTFLIWAPSLKKSISRPARRVTFGGLSFTRAQLQQLDWNHIAEQELQQWDEIRSPEALDTPAGRAWQADQGRREQAAKAAEFRKAARAAKAAHRAAETAGEDAARKQLALAYLDRELLNDAPASFDTCRSLHASYGFCVHHFSDEAANVECVPCTRDHTPRPPEPQPAPGDGSASERIVEVWVTWE
jgi:hypothetical protein